MNHSLTQNYQSVLQRITEAEKHTHREGKVQLLAVSKTKPIESINEIADLGQVAFGENYVQESLEKIALRPDLDWHFIGPIQSNKTNPIANHFNWVHSVDRLKIAQRLSKQRPEHMAPLNILLEVNVSNEASKAGFNETDLMAVVPEILALPNLCLRGLMAIPQKAESLEAQRKPFKKMRALLSQLQEAYPDAQQDSLSMGMSADLEAAIAEGSTMVRIGTDIFGARDYSKKG